MAASKPLTEKKYFTAAMANATLPLVKAIVRDIMELAVDLRERDERLARVRGQQKHGALGDAYQEEIQHIQADFERDEERMRTYVQELKNLGVDLKDPFIGLLDFPCWMNGREVCLCWRSGEPEVSFWHEIDAGFAGRQKLRLETRHN